MILPIKQGETRLSSHSQHIANDQAQARRKPENESEESACIIIQDDGRLTGMIGAHRRLRRKSSLTTGLYLSKNLSIETTPRINSLKHSTAIVQEILKIKLSITFCQKKSAFSSGSGRTT